MKVYPQFELAQYLDTSPASLEAENMAIKYGVNVRQAAGARVRPIVDREGVALVFDTMAEASAECDRQRLKARLRRAAEKRLSAVGAP